MLEYNTWYEKNAFDLDLEYFEGGHFRDTDMDKFFEDKYEEYCKNYDKDYDQWWEENKARLDAEFESSRQYLGDDDRNFEWYINQQYETYLSHLRRNK